MECRHESEPGLATGLVTGTRKKTANAVINEREYVEKVDELGICWVHTTTTTPPPHQCHRQRLAEEEEGV
jgi:hypothetical protein